jgi:predicted nucleic acid-binding protein
VRFWDASAIVPLLISERTSRRLRSLAASDPTMVVWWASEVECVSALVRREREGMLDARTLEIALRQLRDFAEVWLEVEPSGLIRENAVRILRVHALRAADALQLAAAFAAAERRPPSLEMVTLDERLAGAARKEGFVVVDLAIN